jgi:hypothetical protein
MKHDDHEELLRQHLSLRWKTSAKVADQKLTVVNDTAKRYVARGVARADLLAALAAGIQTQRAHKSKLRDEKTKQTADQDDERIVRHLNAAESLINEWLETWRISEAEAGFEIDMDGLRSLIEYFSPVGKARARKRRRGRPWLHKQVVDRALRRLKVRHEDRTTLLDARGFIKSPAE